MDVQAQAGAAAHAENDLLLSNAQEVSRSGEKAKIEKAGRDFESVLLGSWLQDAEKTFATVPGGDEEDGDGTQEQFTGMAMQQLATSLVSAGGIGIARMITDHLAAAATRNNEAPEAKTLKE